MKVLTVLLGQAARFMRLESPSGAVFFPEAVDGLKGRYGFIEYPANLSQYDQDKGVKFLHGKFVINKPKSKSDLTDVTIDNLQIFRNGIIVETRAGSEYADLVIDDLVGWAVKSFNLSIVEYPPVQTSFQSNLEVQFSNNLHSYMQAFDGYLEKFNKAIESYSSLNKPYQVSGICFHCDVTDIKELPPTTFQIERRAGFPYDSNIYFCSAPLKTSDHISLLEEIENLAS